ncbi:MAG: DNA-directed RNA polymerase subunit L [Candidatus Thermoplasmatota archaeon]|nr:DNA-directed RNA polymerase subunit L [Candidatus Thermoplasmatota archaeon]
MEVKVIEETDDEFVFEVIAEKTILNPLKERLLEHEQVDYAGWNVAHPMLANPRFTLRVHEGSPRDIVVAAIRELQDDIASLKEQIEA